ncbi:MAG: Uma2 family endonuclease [Bacteroidota bacterium]
MTTLAPKRIRFTVDSYYKMAELGLLDENRQVELINGDIIDMSPIKSYHAGTVNFLNRALTLSLNDLATVCVQNPIRLDNYSEPEPDIILAKFRSDLYRRKHPTPEDTLLVIEVADSSLQFDREVKGELYATAGIPEYWIVNLTDRQLEVYTEPRVGSYQSKQIFSDSADLQMTVLGKSIDLSELFLKDE